MSDWIKVMLEEIDRKEAEAKAARQEAEKRRREETQAKPGPARKKRGTRSGKNG